MAIPVGTPMVNLGNLYIDGLVVSPGATNLLVNLGAGAARDSTNTNDIVLTDAVVINTAAHGANGLDTGVLAINSTYYVYVIGSSLSAEEPTVHTPTQVSTMADGTIILNGTVVAEGEVDQPDSNVSNNPQPAGILSLSAVQPTLPVGYDEFRRLGSVRTDGAGVILPFAQGPNSLVTYNTPIQVLNAGASAAFAPIVLTSAVPAAAAGGSGFVQVLLDVILTPTAPGNTVAFRPTGSASASGNVIFSGPVAAVATETQLTVLASVIAGVVSIDYKVTGTVTVNVVGYINQG